MAGSAEIVKWKHTQNAEQTQQVKAALKSMMTAARATRQYLAAIRTDGSNQKPETENHLSELWSDAANDMVTVDSELTQRYLMKADYWSDRKGWTEQEKDDRLIELDEMIRLGTKALTASLIGARSLMALVPHKNELQR